VNVSAYVTEAVRRRVAGEQVRAGLAGLGMIVTDEGVRRQRARRLAHEARFTADEWARKRAAARKLAGSPEEGPVVGLPGGRLRSWGGGVTHSESIDLCGATT